MSDLHDDALYRWRRGVSQAFALMAGAGEEYALSLFLAPLRRGQFRAAELVEKAGVDRDFPEALDDVVDDYETTLRVIFQQTRPARDLLGMDSAAGAVGVAAPSASELAQEQSAAADGAVDAGTSAAHPIPSAGGSAGAGSGQPAPASTDSAIGLSSPIAGQGVAGQDEGPATPAGGLDWAWWLQGRWPR